MNRPTIKYFMWALLIMSLASFIAPNIANAKQSGKHHTKQIRVKSGYDNGTAYTSVRYHRGHKQVRGPGGTWVSCFGGCENAYREEFLDFWETIGENSD